MNKHLNKILIIVLSGVLVILGCTKVPVTGRRQLKLLPKANINQLSFSSYQQYLSQNKLSSNKTQSQLVKEVGNDLKVAAEKYFARKGQHNALAGFQWEFNLVEDPVPNAFCMPGGKVVINTGILPITKTKAGLATVMGHEVAHALAHHGNERMSQGLITQLGGVALQVAVSQKPQQTQQMANTAFGVISQVGVLLPFSRLHEREADEIGLYLMAIAGYNPEEAAAFWKRMTTSSGGAKVPEFLSTHPSHQTRIKRLNEHLPTARGLARSFGIPDKK